jgi:hypothetical protein
MRKFSKIIVLFVIAICVIDIISVLTNKAVWNYGNPAPAVSLLFDLFTIMLLSLVYGLTSSDNATEANIKIILGILNIAFSIFVFYFMVF